MTTNLKCAVCGEHMTEQEVATYRNRCEGCWAYDPESMSSAARCYSSANLGDEGKRLDGKVVHKDNHS